MNTGAKELKSILEELDELKLPHIATELKILYKQPNFVNTGRLELISAIIHPKYIVTVTNRYTSRLKKAKLKRSDSCLDQCVDSTDCQYQQQDIVQTLSSLDYIWSGMNLSIFGASDSGKTYLARALGAEACREYRVGYYHIITRSTSFPKLSIPLEKCNLFGVSLHPIPEKEASLSGTECSVFMSNN